MAGSTSAILSTHRAGEVAAVVDDIAERHAQGPADPGRHHLGGEVRAAPGLLKKRGVPHSVLNAKQHADEAKVVAIAGHKGAVTVATYMAGRGTDIMLGGSVSSSPTRSCASRDWTRSRRRGVQRRLAGDPRADHRAG